jgi:cytochrome c5
MEKATAPRTAYTLIEKWLYFYLQQNQPAIQGVINMRIRSTATLHLSAMVLLTASMAASADRQADGEQAYQAKCASCHETGTNGAPVTGNPEDWEQRSDLWEAVLLAHANEGYLAMPAKGGDAQASDYEVGAAAEYLMSVVYPDALPD